MELNLKERLILVNQYRLLTILDPEQSKEYDERRIALECGFESHYFPVEINPDVLRPAHSKEIIAILTMHTDLRIGFDKLVDKTGIELSEIEFTGFDGNNEGRELSYVNYFIKTLGRFTNLDRDDFNSHEEMKKPYRRMLTAWKLYEGKEKITKDNILAVIKAKYDQKAPATDDYVAINHSFASNL